MEAQIPPPPFSFAKHDGLGGLFPPPSLILTHREIPFRKKREDAVFFIKKKKVPLCTIKRSKAKFFSLLD
jgi:hypothetical protein